MRKIFLLICFYLLCATTTLANGAFQQGGKRDWSQRINKFKAPYKLREIKDYDKKRETRERLAKPKDDSPQIIEQEMTGKVLDKN